MYELLDTTTAHQSIRFIAYPSAVESNITRTLPPAAFARSIISRKLCCKFDGSNSTVLAIVQ